MTQAGTGKTLVVKIGSSTLTSSDHSIDVAYLRDLTRQIACLMREGWRVIIVTSAAIASGLEALGMQTRPTDMPTLQAAASVGQCALVGEYARAFAEHGVTSSLVLLTRRDTADRTSYLHARDTFTRLLELGVVPIVNENDTVSVEQIRFGDNDTLAALVSCLVDADLMVILSDIDGLYDADPREDSRARLVSRIERIDRAVMDACGGAGSVAGSGGMVTKVAAARVLMIAGIPMVIAHGKRADVVLDAARGKDVGTRFEARGRVHEITPKKLWIALGNSTHGTLTVDAGARRALVGAGSSLLPVGVCGVSGAFEEGDIVDIADESGFVFARGRVQAGSDEMKLARGMTSEQLGANRILAALADRPVVHRDELVVFE